jgi:hypothetical protein
MVVLTNWFFEHSTESCAIANRLRDVAQNWWDWEALRRWTAGAARKKRAANRSTTKTAGLWSEQGGPMRVLNTIKRRAGVISSAPYFCRRATAPA